jgi:hypothetical protein
VSIPFRLKVFTEKENSNAQHKHHGSDYSTSKIEKSYLTFAQIALFSALLRNYGEINIDEKFEVMTSEQSNFNQLCGCQNLAFRCE